jgi:dTDP-glucose pyrophosphorylase
VSVPKSIWSKALLAAHSTIGQAIKNLDEVAIKIVLVIDSDGTFHGTISDGDIRRGLLKGLNLESPIKSIVHKNALVVPPELSRGLVMQLMVTNKIYQIPIINNRNCIHGLYLWDDFSTQRAKSNLLVIMVGGFGKRLQPLTNDCPKPMLEVAGKPMLAHIIDSAKLQGFNHFTLSINYLGKMIKEYFGNGERFGVKIDYIEEKSPLGTAGSLALINPLPTDPFVVTNGDVLTNIDYGEFLDFHIRHDAVASMAVKLHEWQNPFGVVDINGIEIVGVQEKPILRSYINAGVYVLDPIALNELEIDVYCDMPSLFKTMKESNHRIIAYPMYEPWLDVGRPDDLRVANSQYLNNKK